MTGLEQVETILARYKEEAKQAPISSCAECHIWLQESVTGCRPSPKGPVCSDCYFELLGALVEEHPVTSPKRR